MKRSNVRFDAILIHASNGTSGKNHSPRHPDRVRRLGTALSDPLADKGCGQDLSVERLEMIVGRVVGGAFQGDGGTPVVRRIERLGPVIARVERWCGFGDPVGTAFEPDFLARPERDLAIKPKRRGARLDSTSTVITLRPGTNCCVTSKNGGSQSFLCDDHWYSRGKFSASAGGLGLMTWPPSLKPV